jgi:hypothetical protein
MVCYVQRRKTRNNGQNIDQMIGLHGGVLGSLYSSPFLCYNRLLQISLDATGALNDLFNRL